MRIQAREKRFRFDARHVRGAIAIVIALIVLTASTQAFAATAMVAYGENGASQPRYRLWSGMAWGSEASANTLGSTPQWLVLRGSPTSEQFALATLDNDVDVEVQIWNGSAWSALYQATSDAGDKSTRVFDMAYEQVSGHLVLVYRESGTSQVRYRTYDGTAWSAEFSYAMTGGNIRWLQLIPKKSSDEMMLIVLGDQDNNLSRGALWNGGAFTAQTLVPSDDDGVNVSYQHMTGAFESSSGQGLAAGYQDSQSPVYRTRTGAAWSGAANAPDVGGELRWCRLASDPVSDEILMATFDDKSDLNLTRWNGSGWGSPQQLEKKVGSNACRRFDLCYEPDGNDALVTYNDDTASLRYRTWDGFGWSSEQTGPVGGSQPLWNIQTVTGISGGQIFVTYCTDSPEIRTVVWSGSGFGSVTVLGSSSAPKEYEVFMAAVANGNATLPKLVNWEEVQP